MWQDIFALDSAFMNPSSERMSANPLYLKRRMQLLSRRRPTTSKRNELSRKKKEYLSLRVELLKRTFKLPSPELLSLKNLSLNESSNSINHHPSSSSIFEEEDPVNESFVLLHGSFRGVHSIFDTHSAPISRLSFGRTSSESLFASSLDGSISLVQKLRVFSSRPSLIDAASGIRSFDLSESDEVLIIAEENCLVLRDSATGKVLRSFPDISAFAVRFLPLNNNFLVCLLRSGEVATMNISTGKFASSSPIPGRPSCLTLRGSLLWVSNESGVIDSFKLNPNSGKIQKGCRLHTSQSNKSATILGMDAMSLRGREILLVSFHQSPRDSLALYVIHDEFGSISPLKSIESANARLRCSSFAPVSGLIAAGAQDGSLVLYDPHRDQGRPLVNQLHGHIHPLTAVAFSNDEAFMATADSSGQIIVWKK